MESEAIRDVYLDEDLEKLIIKSRERSLLMYLEEELLRKLNIDNSDCEIFISFLHALDKQNFVVLLRRYFEFIKKEKKYDEYLLVLESSVIIKKEAYSKIKKPVLKISDFFDKKERKLQPKELISEVVQIKYYKDGKISKEPFFQDLNKEEDHKEIKIKDGSEKLFDENDTEKEPKQSTLKADNDISSEENIINQESNDSKQKPKIRGRGNFMWISQTEFEDEESLEIINKLNSNKQTQDEEIENNILAFENENSKEQKINKVNLDKEKSFHKWNNILIKACNDNIDLFKSNISKDKKSLYDKSFEYFFKNPLLEDPKNKSNQNTETIMPKVDHIFCIYDITLNSSFKNTLNNSGNNKEEENKNSCFKIVHEKINKLHMNRYKDSDNQETFDKNNVIELQTNKIYIIIAEDKNNADFLMKELNADFKDEFTQFKINYLAQSPDKIKTCVCFRIGKKIPKPNVAVINRMISSHLKLNSLSKNK